MKKKILLALLALILITPVRAAQNQQRKDDEYSEIVLEDILEDEWSEENSLHLADSTPQAVSVS